jgi:hypothetical protein
MWRGLPKDCNNNPIIYVDPSGNVYILVWSYANADLAEYTDTNGNVDWAKFDAENSFARAADTKKQSLIDMGISESDIVVQRIDNEQSLKDSWDEWAKYDLVEGFDFYSHGTSGGPIVAGGGGGDFLSDAKKLNWGESLRMMNGIGTITGPYAAFHGCNTANGDFAQTFADTQGVTTFAQIGTSSFSRNPKWHIPIKDSATTGKVYLQHFDWKNLKNNYGWGKQFTPSESKGTS